MDPIDTVMLLSVPGVALAGLLIAALLTSRKK